MLDYPGPLRDEPLALELHNTRYADAGEIVDGLADESSAEAWLAALAGRLPRGGAGPGPTADELRELRAPVREALHAVIDGRAPAHASLEAVNAYRRRVVAVPIALWHPHAPPTLELDLGAASRADVVLGTLAADAIELLTGSDLGEIRTCGAPGCVLAFLRRHPRREWCSAACGNRARQARHYARTRLG